MFRMLTACILVFVATPAYTLDEKLLREGDIIFQETSSDQARAIRLATRSRYTHAGIVFAYNGRLRVLEAVQPVRITGLDAFIARGVGGHYVVKRRVNADSLLTEEAVDRMRRTGAAFLGRDYDIYFGWSDERIYCTELIWKIYERALGVRVGRLERLRDFDLSHPYVKGIMRRRYGARVPLDEKVISPESMFRADNLVTVTEE